MTSALHEDVMGLALEQARQAADAGEIPIGAVVLDASGAVVGTGRNRREETGDPTDHAEIVALREAALARGTWRLDGCTLVVTLEPCPMCAGAVVMSRIGRLVLGAWNDDYGAAGSRWDLMRDRRLNHQVEVIAGVRAQECGDLLREFLVARREEVR